MLQSSRRRAFVESLIFTREVDKEGVSVLHEIQAEVLNRLESGKVIPGANGIRKLRVADAGRRKGKRGGYRVLYLDVPELQLVYLLALYDKSVKIDISPAEKRRLAALAMELKMEAF